MKEEEIKEIAKIMLKSLESRLLANGITAEFTDNAITEIAKEGFDPVYGARPLRRAIQNKIEDMLSEKIIGGEIGENVIVDAEDGKFITK